MTISVLLSTATGSNSKEPSTEQRSAAEILLSVSPVMMRTRISTKSQFPTPTRLKFTCYSLGKYKQYWLMELINDDQLYIIASLANIATNELMRSDSSKSKVTLTTTKRYIFKYIL